MIKKNKYVSLWNSKSTNIIQILNNYKNKTFIQLNNAEFDKVGNRKNYSFNLEFINGNISNNISGSAVARDLSIVLTENQTTKNILKKGHFKFNLDRQFCLWIEIN